MIEVQFKKFKFPGSGTAQWCTQKQGDDTTNLIFQFFGDYKPGFDQYLFDAAEPVWDKTDVGYTEEIDAYDIVMTGISAGTEKSLVTLLLKNMSLEYEEI